jgi:mannosyltransferase OCH1-like enzyme
MQPLVTPKWGTLLNQCRLLIQRADIYRCIILEEYGGVYVDCDMLCLKPLDTFLSGDVQVGGCHGGILSAFITVNNGIIFAPHHSKVWDEVIAHMTHAFSTATLLDSISIYTVLRTTGPWLWARVRCTVHPPEYFYSLKVAKRKDLSPKDYDALHESYIYHAQASSWMDNREIGVLLLLLVAAMLCIVK